MILSECCSAPILGEPFSGFALCSDCKEQSEVYDPSEIDPTPNCTYHGNGPCDCPPSHLADD